MDAVLGLSVTPSAVGLVLVQGQDSDGDAMDGTGFEVDASGSWSAVQTSEQAVEAVLRAEAIAAGRGHRVQSIGVTWSDKADAEAALLLKSLSDSGFGNIVPVRLSEATDALARGIAEVAGYRTTAVCVIEPEHLIALVVAPQQGAVQTAVNHSVVTEQDLAGWLSTVFTKADWRPEALVLVGSAEDLDGLRPILQDALSVPVFTPAEAQLALARGAALACAQTAEFRLDNSVRAVVGDDLWDVAGNSTAGNEQPTPLRRGARHRTQVGPAAVLAAGVVTFVASASAALALQAAPERSDPQARAGADASARAPLAVRGTTPAPLQQSAPKREAAPLAAPEVAQPPTAEVAQPPTAEVAQPPTAEVAQPPTALAAPVPDARQISQEAALAVAMRLEPEAPAAPPPLDAPPAPFGAAPPDMMTPDAVPPQEPPGLVQRIRDRLSGPDQPPVDVPPPPGAPLP